VNTSRSCELFLDGWTFKIKDGRGRAVTPERARKLWEAGRVSNCNLAMRRLATGANWDFDELRRQYHALDAGATGGPS
jgi:hypothetical protein